MTKLIALDCDGVLKYHPFYGSPADLHEYTLAPDCLSNLFKIMDATGAICLLTSSWRFNSNAVQSLKNESKIPIIALTGSVSYFSDDHTRRGREIDAWLKKNDLLDLESLVILDDDSDFLPEQMMHFVQTNIHDGGLRADHVAMAIRILTLPVFSQSPYLVNRRVNQKLKSAEILV